MKCDINEPNTGEYFIVPIAKFVPFPHIPIHFQIISEPYRYFDQFDLTENAITKSGT